MPVKDFCTNELISISANASLSEAAKLMKDKRVGSLVVFDDAKKKCKGFITDRDIALYAFSEGAQVNMTVENVMTREVATVSEKSGIYDVLEKMEKHELRRIVVVDDDEQVCGVLSSDDIVQLIAKEMSLLGNLFAKQSKMATSQRL